MVGLGYVGLPLVVEAVRSGLSVVGCDISPAVVSGLNAGRSHISDVSSDEVAAMLARGFRATTDEITIGIPGTIVICVPTPLATDGGPDLAAVRSAAEMSARLLRPGSLVVLESTTYPGTTDEVVRPLLEKLSGLSAGLDFALAFSPERIDPGNPVFGIRNTPKVVGGFTPSCTESAALFYSKLCDQVVRAASTREAEMAKLLENTYRHVNIALVNEMAIFSNELGVDLWDAIRCAATKPFGFQPFFPGPGVGGHCIPIDPNYLSYKVRTLGYPFRFAELAQEINHSMPGLCPSPRSPNSQPSWQGTERRPCTASWRDIQEGQYRPARVACSGCRPSPSRCGRICLICRSACGSVDRRWGTCRARRSGT